MEGRGAADVRASKKIIHVILITTEAVAQRCFIKKGVLRNLEKFTGKHLRQSLFFNKVAGLRAAPLLKRDSGPGVFL